MRIICGCGGQIFSRYDLICHFKERGFWRGMRHLLHTRIDWSDRGWSPEETR